MLHHGERSHQRSTYLFLLSLLLLLLLELLLLGLGQDPARGVDLAITSLRCGGSLGRLLLLPLPLALALLREGKLVVHGGLLGSLGGEVLCGGGGLGDVLVVLREALLLPLLLVLAHEAHQAARGGLLGCLGGIVATGGICARLGGGGGCDALAQLGLPVVLARLVSLLLGRHRQCCTVSVLKMVRESRVEMAVEVR